MSDTMKASDTTIAAWKMALKNRPLQQDLLFHSDTGVQYACTGIATVYWRDFSGSHLLEG
jgi:hypothetical protein